MVRPAFDSDVKWELWSHRGGSALTREVNCLLLGRLEIPSSRVCPQRCKQMVCLPYNTVWSVTNLIKGWGKVCERSFQHFQMSDGKRACFWGSISGLMQPWGSGYESANEEPLSTHVYSLPDSLVPCLRPSHSESSQKLTCIFNSPEFVSLP